MSEYKPDQGTKGLSLFEGLTGPPKGREPASGTQCAKVLGHMRRNGSISDLDAWQFYRIRRLAARIYDLREAGWTITATDEAHEGGTHARYHLGT